MVNNQENWETQETIQWLTNDEGVYGELLDIVANADDQQEAENAVYQYVVREQAGPSGLYENMNRPPKSSWDDVDWASVVESLHEE
jgi:hypothetical protein